MEKSLRVKRFFEIIFWTNKTSVKNLSSEKIKYLVITILILDWVD